MNDRAPARGVKAPLSFAARFFRSRLRQPSARPHWGLPRDPAAGRALPQICCGERAAAVEITSQHQIIAMNKPTIQDTELSAPRKLNMEEKRKLERLLIADIDSATYRCDADAKDARQVVIERLARTPAAEVKKLHEQYKLACKQRDALDAKLRELGFSVDYNGQLSVRSHGTLPKQLVEFDSKAEEKRRALAALKRTYVIRLFADHADTQGLFGALAKDLERLIG
jgi:hypothetical protein